MPGNEQIEQVVTESGFAFAAATSAHTPASVSNEVSCKPIQAARPKRGQRDLMLEYFVDELTCRVVVRRLGIYRSGLR